MIWSSYFLGFFSLLTSIVVFCSFLSTSYSFSKPFRVAICLVGGLREFELTGPSIRTYLLPAYKNADVFIVTPHDKDAWKVYLLHETHVVAVRIEEQKDVPVDEIVDEIFPDSASPTGKQGLLKYLALMEACKELVEEYERRNGFRYDWILRTRPDSVWQSRPLPLSFYFSNNFYIPPGSDWWGINDRLTLGKRDWTLTSMAGLSSIPTHYRLGQIRLTSEDKFEKHLANEGILRKVVRSHFPFCVLSRRGGFNFPPLDIMDGRVAPLGTVSARDGAYCRPCEVERRPSVLKVIPMSYFGMKHYCNASGPWTSDWIFLFRKAVGQEEWAAYDKFQRENNRCSCYKNVGTFSRGPFLQQGGFTPESLCAAAFPVNGHKSKSFEDCET